MVRKYIDCREIPSESHCTVAISADSEDELVEAAVQHAVAVHRHYNTQELRLLIKRGIRQGTPPVETLGKKSPVERGGRPPGLGA